MGYSKRVARKKLIWRVYWQDDWAIHLAANSGVKATTAQPLITAAELEDLDDVATVVRIVGEFTWLCKAQDNETALDEGRLLQGIGVIGDEFSTANVDLTLPGVVQDFPWMWLKTSAVCCTGSQNEGGNALSYNSDDGGFISRHIDIRVKRKMNPGDELMMWSDGLFRGAPWYVLSMINLRILLEA